MHAARVCGVAVMGDGEQERRVCGGEQEGRAGFGQDGCLLTLEDSGASWLGRRRQTRCDRQKPPDHQDRNTVRNDRDVDDVGTSTHERHKRCRQ